MTVNHSGIGHLVKNRCHRVDGIWQIEGAEPFRYSDGADTENYIYDVVRSAVDISTRSRELETKIIDWPTRYHLSRERTLVYESLQFKPGSRILEVGSGCGSISRFLGETGCEVLSLEASLRRAKITRERTRDLPNVQVLSAPFQLIEYQEPFDIIICNGVFEYSGVFVDAVKPYETILEYFRRALRSSGSLVIAIENQFGLRYWTSSEEDHNGELYDGIEGYPRFPKGARTFGKSHLDKLLRHEFSQVDWLLPLDDYKLPSAVIHEKLTESVDVSELLIATSTTPHAAAVLPRFHEKLAWKEIALNGWASVFSNSHIAIAHNGDGSLVADGWLGTVYSLKRHPWFSTRTDFRQDPLTGRVTVDKKRWEPSAVAPPSPLGHVTKVGQPWAEGVSLRTCMARLCVERSNKPLTARAKPMISAWWTSLERSSTGKEVLLAPAMLDAIWNNVYLQEDGAISFIDLEWTWGEGVPAAWLVLRAVRRFVDAELPFVHRWSPTCQAMTEWDFMLTIGSICGINMDDSQLQIALQLENRFHHLASGCVHATRSITWDALVVKHVSIRLRQRLARLRRGMDDRRAALRARLSKA